MFATVHVSPPSCQALLRKKPRYRYQPIAVLEEVERIGSFQKDKGKARILEFSDEAADMGVRLGMTAAQGLARCECLVLLNRDPDAEAALADELCRIAGQFTPDFEMTAAGVVTLDLNGIAEIQTEDVALHIGRRMTELLAASDMDGQVGFAPNPDLAFLAGKCGEQVNILTSAAAIHSQPLALLDIEPALSDVFDTWGIRNLGGLVDLPRPELVDRLGEFAGELWDRAAGISQRLLNIERPVPVFDGEIDFHDYEINALEAVLFSLQRLLEEITDRLATSYQVAEEIWLRLFFSNGTDYQRRFRIADPSGDAAKLLDIVHTHLNGLAAKAPITGLHVRAIPARRGRHQFDLFSSSIRDPNKLSETLTRLEAILGPERIGEPLPLPAHRPDAFDLAPFDLTREPEFQADQTAMKGLALRRFRPRIHVQVEFGELKVPGIFEATELFGREDPVALNRETAPVIQGCSAPNFVKGNPVAEGGIIKRLGPWRFSGSWWEEADKWKREEWDVALETNGIFRLVRDCGEWFLEGVYA